MREIVIAGDGLRLRRADVDDLEYILGCQNDPENSPYILRFERERWLAMLDGRDETKTTLIIESDDGARCGYLVVDDHIDEITLYLWHLVVGRGHKGRGVGHGAMRLLKRWAFDVLGRHRLYIDCEDTNARAIHLYESEGLRREGLLRESVIIDGEYKNLIVFAMLDREYREEESSC